MRYGLDFSKHEETEECHFKKIPHAQTNEVSFGITSLFKKIKNISKILLTDICTVISNPTKNLIL